MRKGACDKALADTAGTGDEHIELLLDPAERSQYRNELRIDTARRTRIKVLKLRTLRQLRPTQALCEALGVAIADLVLDHHAQALLEAQALVLCAA